ncbi:hypothetical protein [Solimicrobium silvestre]|uniref:Uncharacterized protein n=1 Tax=Solimicrobium silvestre TaxID=2099400 RepID=A0A2S9GZP0_9BURK|nr:hypothetical protein [Solimicrobium silvestre]PRC93177.1 hypothetical protein S2091_2263 [Solimicrobium silvestre]
MKILSAFVAVISGIVLGNLIIYVSGYLAAIAIPREYFLWFGKPHITMALIIYDAIVMGLPRVIIATIWCVCTILVFRKKYLLLITAWCFGGYVLTQAYWDWKFDFGINYPTLFIQQPWAILSIIAAPCGILFAGIFFYKSHHANYLSP